MEVFKLFLLFKLFLKSDIKAHRRIYGKSDGRVVRPFAFGAVDSGLLLSQVELMTVKLVFAAFLLDT